MPLSSLIPPAAPRRAGSSTRTAAKVTALQRGIDVLNCFVPVNQPLSHTELSRLTGLPKATVTRLVATLLHAGLLRQDHRSDKYELGPRVPSFSSAYFSTFDVRAFARPLMERLALDTDLSVQLTVPADLDMLIIEVCRPPTSMLVTRLDIGGRIPMSTSAAGRAYLASVDPGTREALLRRMEVTHGEHWGPIRKQVDVAIREAQRLGYCRSMGEFYPDVHAIASALHTPRGDIVALNCGGPSTLLSRQRIVNQVGPMLVDVTVRLGAVMGA